jgi:hypothetical protein
MAACARAITAAGCQPRNFGRIPTPALAAYGISEAMPTMMVTGSHIPDDRNGIKFNLPSGEILKDDEECIRAEDVQLPDTLFDADVVTGLQCTTAKQILHKAQGVGVADPVGHIEHASARTAGAELDATFRHQLADMHDCLARSHLVWNPHGSELACLV